MTGNLATTNRFNKNGFIFQPVVTYFETKYTLFVNNSPIFGFYGDAQCVTKKYFLLLAKVVKLHKGFYLLSSAEIEGAIPEK